MIRVCLVIAVVLFGSRAFAQSEPSLFVYSVDNAGAAPTGAAERSAVTSRARVSMRLDLMFDARGDAADRLLLNAGDQEWTARVERVDRDRLGFRSWVGYIDGITDSHVVFSERDGMVSGLINAVGTTYQVRTERPGAYLLERIDVTQLADEREPLDAAAPASGSRNSGSVVASDDPGTIDILILYSPAARSKMGGTAQMEAIAAQIISDTNTAFARSGVAPRGRLAGAFELPFVESPQMATDLPALRTSADAQALRELARADVVQLLVSSPDQASCGIGYLLSNETPDFDAYSIADVSCLAQYTPTHEMAHNMGSHHAPEDGASGALFPYSYAYKDQERGFRTIMAYPCVLTICTRIPNFSNPRVPFEGALTGTPTQDNARSINEAAPYVANFRSATGIPSAPPATPTGLRSTVIGSAVTVTWNAVAAASYVLQAGTLPGISNLFNASVGAVTSASGTLAAGSYYWRVIAINGVGESAPSLEAQFFVAGCTPPFAPTEFRHSVLGRTVSLTWNAFSAGAAATYLLEAGSAPGLANLLVSPVGSATTLVTPAPPGTYHVRVRAQNACGTSAPSNEQLIVVP